MNVNGIVPDLKLANEASIIIMNTKPLAPYRPDLKNNRFNTPVTNAVINDVIIKDLEPYFSSKMGPRISIKEKLPTKCPQSA